MLQTIAVEVQRPAAHVANVLKMLEEGATVPFMARYRKEVTGSMDEDVLRTIQDRAAQLKELAARKTAVLKSIEEQGRLTDELRARIDQAPTLQQVEDLYLPYRPKRRTRAMMAREKGLQPLADLLAEQKEPIASLEALAAPFVQEDLTAEQALAGAGDILAEGLSDNADVRAWLRDYLFKHAAYVAAVTKEWAGKKSKFEAYYDYRRNVRDIASHAVLALRRGEKEEVLSVKLDVDPQPAVDYLARILVKRPGSPYGPFLSGVASDAWQRLLKPSLSNEVDGSRKEVADGEAIQTFAVNLKALLLSAPAGEKNVMGVDPGFRTGCKVAVVDRTGKLVDHATIYPTEPRKDEEGAARIVLALMQKHNIELIAIGNGTASRETDAFVARTLSAVPAEKRPVRVMVSEAGASVYSASPIAKEEFPTLDVTIRGAISIARRLQDPLAELVKIEPRSIGVGQYQHDVDQKALEHSLEGVVESCVNHVGVDLNTASAALLRFISGVNATLAKNIVSYRNEQGAFHRRQDLLKVPRLGPKAFEQAAGFLRIRNATNPLDNSAVHPERYAIVEQMAKDVGLSVDHLVGNEAAVNRIDLQRYVRDDVGLETLTDIQQELLKPGRDPRQEFRYADFREELQEVKDLKPGMVLEGVVTNVTAFGAFVDVGVHQDGLVHRSELAWRFVQNPAELVKVGDIVKVKVLGVDLELKRISLSIKQTQPQPATAAAGAGRAPHQGTPPRPQQAPPPQRPAEPPRSQGGPASLRDKLKAWEQNQKKR